MVLVLVLFLVLTFFLVPVVVLAFIIFFIGRINQFS